MASRSSLVDLADAPPTRHAIAKPRRSFFQRTPRWARAILIAIAAVYGVYLLAANILLRTHLLRGWLTGDGSSLLVDYGSARSLLPGSVVLHDVRIRHQDNAVQMLILADRASFDIDLLSLIHRTASLHHAHVEGVTYRLRQRLDSLDGNEGRARAFPLIDGFPASPLAALQPPLHDRPGRRWTVEIDALDASVREVWTMEYRLLGTATLTGGFHLEPNEIVQVLPSSMHVVAGTLSLGESDFARGRDWTLDATVDPFAPRNVKGADVLRYISFAVKQRADVLGLAPIGSTYLPGDMALAEGAGPLAVDVRVDHGIVQAESTISYRAGKASFRDGAMALESDIDLAASVDTSDPPHIVAASKIAHGTLTPATGLTDLHAELSLRGLDTTAPFAIDTLSAALGSAHSADLRAWNALPALRDAQLTFTGGAATVAAHGDYARGALGGRVETKLDHVGLRTGDTFSVVCSGTSSTNVKATNVKEAITLPGAKVDVHDVSMKLLGSEASGMWMRARSGGATIATTGETKADVQIAVESGPGASTTKLFTGLAHLPDVAADLTAGSQLEAGIALRVRHDDVSVDIMRAKDGVIEGAGRLHHRAGKKATGAFLITAGRVSAGIDITDSGVTIVPLATADWLRTTAAQR